MRLIFILIGCFFIISINTRAQQREVFSDEFVWLNLAVNKKLSDNSSLTAAAQSRRFVLPDRKHQLLLTAKYTKKINSGFYLAAGYTHFFQSLPVSRNPVVVTRHHLRPFQEIGISSTMNKWKLAHRWIVEERWFRNTLNGEIADGYTFSWRFRYKLAVERIIGAEGKSKVIAYNEILIRAGKNAEDNIFDQNRVYLGINRQLSSRFTGDIGYMYWFQQFPTITDYGSFNILFVGVSLNF